MIEKFNKNAKVEKFTNMMGIAVRLIVIGPLQYGFHRAVKKRVKWKYMYIAGF